MKIVEVSIHFDSRTVMVDVELGADPRGVDLGVVSIPVGSDDPAAARLIADAEALGTKQFEAFVGRLQNRGS